MRVVSHSFVDQHDDRELLVIAERLDLAGDRRVGHEEVGAAAQSWGRLCAKQILRREVVAAAAPQTNDFSALNPGYVRMGRIAAAGSAPTPTATKIAVGVISLSAVHGNSIPVD